MNRKKLLDALEWCLEKLPESAPPVSPGVYTTAQAEAYRIRKEEIQEWVKKLRES